MTTLNDAGTPKDVELPELSAMTLRTLSDDIIEADAALTAGGASGDARVIGLSSRRGPWVRRVVVAAAAVAALAIGTTAVLPTQSAEAAGWAATPTLATGTTNAQLATQCQDRMHTSAPAVIVEQRGASNFTVLADSSECLNAQGADIPGALITGGRDFVPPQRPAADGVQVIHAASLGSVGPGSAPGSDAVPAPTAGYMGVFGRVGAAVENVVIHTTDHGDVTASVDHGWFAAWWPSLTPPTSLTVTTTSGHYVVHHVRP